jgi:hypothetical protein
MRFYKYAAPRALKQNRRAGCFVVRENSPAIYGWEYGQSFFPSPARDGRPFLSSLTGLVTIPHREPSHKWLGYFQGQDFCATTWPSPTKSGPGEKPAKRPAGKSWMNCPGRVAKAE